MGIVELVGQLDPIADAFAEPCQIRIIGVAAHDEAEFVAAEPGEFHPLRAKALADLADAAAGLDQDAVADAVTIIVVDRLEAVEVDDADRNAHAAPLGVSEGARQLGEEAAAVRQLGEGIEIGEAEVLVRERQRRRLLRQQRFAAADEIGEVAIVDEQHRHHRAGDQQIVDRDCFQRGLAGSPEEQHIGHVDDQGHDQRRRTQMHQREDAADHGHGHVEGDLALGEGIAVRVERKGPGREAGGDRQRQPVGGAQIAQDVGIAAHEVALPQPPQGSQAREYGQHGGHNHRQPVRRDVDVSIRDRDRVADQDEVEQRDLLGEGIELRARQIRVDRNAEQPHGGGEVSFQIDSRHRNTRPKTLQTKAILHRGGKGCVRWGFPRKPSAGCTLPPSFSGRVHW